MALDMDMDMDLLIRLREALRSVGKGEKFRLLPFFQRSSEALNGGLVDYDHGHSDRLDSSEHEA